MSERRRRTIRSIPVSSPADSLSRRCLGWNRETATDLREPPVHALRRVADLYAHLAATGESPIDPKTNRWLGGAEAIAAGATSPGIDPETRRKRVRQAERVLSAADEPENGEATAHLERVREVCRSILAADY